MLTQEGLGAMHDIGKRFLHRKTAELHALQAEIDTLRQSYPDEAAA